MPPRPALAAALALSLAGGLAGAASAQDGWGPGRHDRWDWRGPDGGRALDLAGPGVPLLIPELRDTGRGRAFVRRNFDWNHDGYLDRREALAANRAFLDAAGPRYDRERRGFDWEARDREPPPPPPPSRADEGGWDRGAMHGYGFRQNRYGAVFTLQDVLFETGSARLRPTADAKLRPLAAYLRANPTQRLRIDGYTDSVGTAQANLILSRDRARSVADALAAMGVDAGRFQLEGHGEDSPVSTNATAEGRQLNRRVEVTLLGRQASSF